MKVAELAVKACTIKHGGRNMYSRTTAKVFAERIHINPRTLYEWIRVKRLIVDKLTPTQIDDLDNVSADLFKEVITGVSHYTAPKKIQRKFRDVIAKHKDEHRMIKYIKHLNTIIYNVANHSRMWNCSDQILFVTLKKCREICTYIELEMKVRKKQIPVKYNQPKVNLDEFWNKEIEL